MYDISLLFLLAVVVSNRATYKQLLLVLVPSHTAYLSEMSAIKSMNTSYFLQISSHVKAIDAIYQGTDFMGIRNISFMVKRIRVSLLQIGRFCILGLFTVFPVNQLSPSSQINTTSDERDKSNPFRFANIGVEKFLELNSEQNHDDYCLAYVFTDRDFDDGVLGLAWVGAPSGTQILFL